jgi:hypothetical protein
MRRSQGIAILIAQDGILGEGRVIDIEKCLPMGEVIEGDVAGFRLLVNDDGMAMGEGPPFHILAGEADRIIF